jgi:hypothetical protein
MQMSRGSYEKWVNPTVYSMPTSRFPKTLPTIRTGSIVSHPSGSCSKLGTSADPFAYASLRAALIAGG